MIPKARTWTTDPRVPLPRRASVRTVALRPRTPDSRGTARSRRLRCRPPQQAYRRWRYRRLENRKRYVWIAEKLHRRAEHHNRGKDGLAQRHFRVGIWSEKVALLPKKASDGSIVGWDFAGTAIANATRLEGACKTGEVLIGSQEWAELTREERRLFGPEENSEGKTHRRISKSTGAKSSNPPRGRMKKPENGPVPGRVLNSATSQTVSSFTAPTVFGDISVTPIAAAQPPAPTPSRR